MCGIAGRINSEIESDPHLFGKPKAELNHRGPDDFGYLFYTDQEGLHSGSEWLDREVVSAFAVVSSCRDLILLIVIWRAIRATIGHHDNHLRELSS